MLPSGIPSKVGQLNVNCIILKLNAFTRPILRQISLIVKKEEKSQKTDQLQLRTLYWLFIAQSLQLALRFCFFYQFFLLLLLVLVAYSCSVATVFVQAWLIDWSWMQVHLIKVGLHWLYCNSAKWQQQSRRSKCIADWLIVYVMRRPRWNLLCASKCQRRSPNF